MHRKGCAGCFRVIGEKELMLKRAKKIIRNDIFQWFLNKDLTAFEAEKTVSELPIIFGVKKYGSLSKNLLS